MTQFDLIALLILAASGLIGFARGALREMTTVIAFLVAIAAALFLLRFTGPVARHHLHTAWIGNAVALVAGFVVSYILIRIIGSMITRGVQGVQALGGLDRLAGLGIGLIRGFVILGAFQLVFAAATPPERMPHWISHAALYPAAIDSGRVLKALEPKGLAVVGKLAPALQHAVTEGGADKSVETPR